MEWVWVGAFCSMVLLVLDLKGWEVGGIWIRLESWFGSLLSRVYSLRVLLLLGLTLDYELFLHISNHDFSKSRGTKFASRVRYV